MGNLYSRYKNKDTIVTKEQKDYEKNVSNTISVIEEINDLYLFYKHKEFEKENSNKYKYFSNKCIKNIYKSDLMNKVMYELKNQLTNEVLIELQLTNENDIVQLFDYENKKNVNFIYDNLNDNKTVISNILHIMLYIFVEYFVSN